MFRLLSDKCNLGNFVASHIIDYYTESMINNWKVIHRRKYKHVFREILYRSDDPCGRPLRNWETAYLWSICIIGVYLIAYKKI